MLDRDQKSHLIRKNFEVLLNNNIFGFDQLTQLDRALDVEGDIEPNFGVKGFIPKESCFHPEMALIRVLKQICKILEQLSQGLISQEIQRNRH